MGNPEEVENPGTIPLAGQTSENTGAGSIEPPPPSYDTLGSNGGQAYPPQSNVHFGNSQIRKRLY